MKSSFSSQYKKENVVLEISLRLKTIPSEGGLSGTLRLINTVQNEKGLGPEREERPELT